MHTSATCIIIISVPFKHSLVIRMEELVFLNNCVHVQKEGTPVKGLILKAEELQTIPLLLGKHPVKE